MAYKFQDEKKKKRRVEFKTVFKEILIMMKFVYIGTVN